MGFSAFCRMAILRRPLRRRAQDGGPIRRLWGRIFFAGFPSLCFGGWADSPMRPRRSPQYGEMANVPAASPPAFLRFSADCFGSWESPTYQWRPFPHGERFGGLFCKPFTCWAFPRDGAGFRSGGAVRQDHKPVRRMCSRAFSPDAFRWIGSDDGRTRGTGGSQRQNAPAAAAPILFGNPFCPFLRLTHCGGRLPRRTALTSTCRAVVHFLGGGVERLFSIVPPR